MHWYQVVEDLFLCLLDKLKIITLTICSPEWALTSEARTLHILPPFANTFRENVSSSDSAANVSSDRSWSHWLPSLSSPHLPVDWCYSFCTKCRCFRSKYCMTLLWDFFSPIQAESFQGTLIFGVFVAWANLTASGCLQFFQKCISSVSCCTHCKWLCTILPT